MGSPLGYSWWDPPLLQMDPTKNIPHDFPPNIHSLSLIHHLSPVRCFCLLPGFRPFPRPKLSLCDGAPSPRTSPLVLELTRRRKLSFHLDCATTHSRSASRASSSWLGIHSTELESIRRSFHQFRSITSSSYRPSSTTSTITHFSGLLVASESPRFEVRD